MNRQEITATMKAMQIIFHLKGHIEEMAERETGNMQELLKMADDSLGLACQTLNSAIVLAMTDGGDPA